MHLIKLFLAFFVFCATAVAQDNLPVLKANSNVLSIKDGDIFMGDYWTLDPSLSVDVYKANKTSRKKSIVFYSDIDSISFDLSPRGQHDFLVILNEKDTFKTQIKSSIDFIDTAIIDLEQDTIPFVLTRSNNIIIQTVLNENDTLDLMFHTAQNTISLTEDAVKKIKQNAFDKSLEAESWGGSHSTRYSTGNRIRIKNFEWNDITLWEDKNSGPSSDGKFGPNLFGNKVIELNFDENILVIHSYLPTLKTGYKKGELLFERNTMYIVTNYKIDGKDYTNKVMIHSGYGGTILLDDKYVNDNNIAEKLSLVSESQLQDSYGNVLKTKKVILPYLTIGDKVFKEIPIHFFEGVISNQSVSVMGGSLIKRFNIFFDLQQAEIYLKPSKLSTLPFEDS